MNEMGKGKTGGLKGAENSIVKLLINFVIF